MPEGIPHDYSTKMRMGLVLPFAVVGRFANFESVNVDIMSFRHLYLLSELPTLLVSMALYPTGPKKVLRTLLLCQKTKLIIVYNFDCF